MNRRSFIMNALAATALVSPGKVLGSDYEKDKGYAERRRTQDLQNKTRKIDGFSHFSFPSLIDFLEKAGGPLPPVVKKTFLNTPTLMDVNQRLRLMDKYGIEANVVVPNPWLEIAPAVHADPKLAAQASSLCNDELSKVVAQYPDRFFAVAVLPVANPEIMMIEFERAIKELGFVGAHITVGPHVKRPDHQDYEPLYRRAFELDVPIWIHPTRPPTYPDYGDEAVSKYQIWQAFSWVLDESAAVVRLALGGIFQRYPSLKMVIHHHGAMIPLFGHRVIEGIDYTELCGGVKHDISISKPYINHFKKFYCDTATQGGDPALLQIAYNFFDADHILFGSDIPMDSKGGEIFASEAIRSVEALNISEAERQRIYSGNILRLLKRK